MGIGFLIFLIDSLIFAIAISALYVGSRKELNEVKEKLDRDIRSLGSVSELFDSKINEIWGILKVIGGYESLSLTGGCGFLGILPRPKPKNYLDDIKAVQDLILNELGYKFQPSKSTEEPAKLVKIEKKEDKKADGANYIAGSDTMKPIPITSWSIDGWTYKHEDGKLNILRDGKVVMTLTPNGTEAKPQEEKKN
ncbi:MAG: hypothetical protein HF309_18140 [Ignavibacteria bacterium]|jgi:hypothetical protein|nr:hypothetical protein [Ignavibacteria bacterium]MCU7518539.1 hypothetical protein [Ignavibacteria bacterium]